MCILYIYKYKIVFINFIYTKMFSDFKYLKTIYKLFKIQQNRNYELIYIFINFTYSFITIYIII